MVFSVCACSVSKKHFLLSKLVAVTLKTLKVGLEEALVSKSSIAKVLKLRAKYVEGASYID